jgi:glycosyltransferase involved in cell wall biosynthesis
LEIIVVDDGSTDKTKDILYPYIEKSQIKYVFQNNKGLSGARNTGIAESHGEYVSILDSDDLMLKDKIWKQVQILEKNRDYGVVYSGLTHFMDVTNETFRLKYKYYSGEIFEKLIYGNFINPNAVMFRKDLFNRYGGFDDKIRSSEDWDYWLKLASNGVLFYFLPDILTLYRVRKNSLSADSITMKSSSLYVLNKYSRHDDLSLRKKIEWQIFKWKIKLGFSYSIGEKKRDMLKTLSWKENKRFFPLNFVFMGLFYFIPVGLLRRSLSLLRKIKFKIVFKKIGEKNVS